MKKADIETVFQSTLPVGEATEAGLCTDRSRKISIHASRGGSDIPERFVQYPVQHFNPRFPRGKRPCAPDGLRQLLDISIHASREGSDEVTNKAQLFTVISIHASREGSDIEIKKGGVNMSISIHASREGSDMVIAPFVLQYVSISIHASREGSDATAFLTCSVVTEFQSTLPAREATSTVSPWMPTT